MVSSRPYLGSPRCSSQPLCASRECWGPRATSTPPTRGSSAALSPQHSQAPPGGLGSMPRGAGNLAGNPRSAETRCAMQPSPLPCVPPPPSPSGQPGTELWAVSLCHVPARCQTRGAMHSRRRSSPGVAEEPVYLFRGSAPLPRPSVLGPSVALHSELSGRTTKCLAYEGDSHSLS